jgi:hypothetical protein
MGEEGKTEQEILRYFSKPDLASHPDNHVIPLLDEIEHGDACFAVTPLLHDGLMDPWFHNVGEILDGISQTLKVSSILKLTYSGSRCYRRRFDSSIRTSQLI